MNQTADAQHMVSDEKICGSCGATIKRMAEICPKCGVRQRTPVSKPLLLLITFFTGGLGGHKFYTGRYWQGGNIPVALLDRPSRPGGFG